MTDDDPINPALLPAGLRDLLPPDAETEAASVEALMEVFTGHGYARVKPPLLEFADSLLAGAGAAVADQTFRLMDPDSQRMMGLRADTTPQVARIAATRLATAPRPLRLCYAGQCLLVRGSQLAPDRQIAQAGIELIGPDSPAADAEIVLVGAEALAAVGLTQFSFDLTVPTLSPALLDDAGIAGPDRLALVRSVDCQATIDHFPAPMQAGNPLAQRSTTDPHFGTHPSMGSVAARFRGPNDAEMPAFVGMADLNLFFADVLGAGPGQDSLEKRVVGRQVGGVWAWVGACIGVFTAKRVYGKTIGAAQVICSRFRDLPKTRSGHPWA